jgi:hypothetical protein
MMPLSGIIDRLSFRDKLVRKAAKATAKAKTAVKEAEVPGYCRKSLKKSDKDLLQFKR